MNVYYFTFQTFLIMVIVTILAVIAYRTWERYNKEYITDSFGRLRISHPFTLGDYKQSYGLTEDMLINTESNGTVTHNTNESSVKLAVTATNGSRAVHQSKMYHHYMPGKSQFVLSSFVFFDPVSGIVKRTGYYDDRDGLFFEQGKDGKYYFVIRSFTSGVAVETKIPKDEWNGNKITLDFSKTQLLWLDFQWLGVGRVRFGFVHKDEYILCHTFYNSNNLDKVYMSNPNLPVRCEILNSGSTQAGFMNQICSTVISEGGYSEAGKDYSYISDSTQIANNNNNETDILGIRLATQYKNNANRIFLRLSDVKIFTESKNVIYRIYKADSFTNGTELTDDDYDGGAEIFSGITATNKSLIASGTVVGGSQGNRTYGSESIGKPGDAKKNFISQNFDSTSSEAFIISIQKIEDNNTNVIISLNWREIY